MTFRVALGHAAQRQEIAANKAVTVDDCVTVGFQQAAIVLDLLYNLWNVLVFCSQRLMVFEMLGFIQDDGRILVGGTDSRKVHARRRSPGFVGAADPNAISISRMLELVRRMS